MIRDRASFLLALTASLTLASTAWSELTVVGVQPAPRSLRAPRNGAIVIDFDRPVRPGSVVLQESFWAFGQQSGVVNGTLGFSRGRRRVTLRRDHVFAAGENVTVILSHDVQADDGSFLRSGGYSFQFRTQVRRSPMRFVELERLTTLRPSEVSTVPYGGVATDLDEDHFLDLAIANNVTDDVRVFLNQGDRTGSYRPFLEPGFAAGRVPSPSETSDFDRDGHVDIALAGAEGTVAVLLGNGNGTFRPTQVVEVGLHAWGIAVLDADGDGDVDVISSVRLSENGAGDLALLENDGSGFFGPPVYFPGAGPGEYGLAAADMNEDGLLDLVVGDTASGRIFVQAGNGDGTFTRAGARYSGGSAWVLTVGDVNGDRHEDVTVVHPADNSAAILLGDGTGRLSAPRVVAFETPYSTDIGDLDGDGDLDWVISQYGRDLGAGGWSILTNDGRGRFAETHYIPARLVGSCALLFDVDNDRDLDLVLVDEIQNELLVYRNQPGGPQPAY